MESIFIRKWMEKVKQSRNLPKVDFEMFSGLVIIQEIKGNDTERKNERKRNDIVNCLGSIRVIEKKQMRPSVVSKFKLDHSLALKMFLLGQ
jgi:hypothetical protein